MGFGSHMLDYLISKNKYKLYGLVKINAQKRNIKHLLNKVEFIEGDICDKYIQIIDCNKNQICFSFCRFKRPQPIMEYA